MRNIANWPTADVITPRARATVGGRAVTVVSVDVKRELPRTQPGQVAMTGGITAATGSLVIAPFQDVSERVPTPWTTPGYPKLGERVAVWASHDGVETRIFTGRVDAVSGGIDSPEVHLDLVDEFDKLNQQLSTPALARTMPPLSTQGDGRQRMTGLLSTWVTDFAARASGFYATPPMDNFCVVSVPLQGSTWPQRGLLRNSYRAANVDSWQKYHPGAVETDGTIYMYDVYAEYEIDPYDVPYSGPIADGRPLNLTLMASANQGTSSYVAARWANGWQLRLACTSTRELRAQTVAPDGTVTTVGLLRPSVSGDWRVATVRWRTSSTTSLAAEIFTDTGKTSTTAFVTAPPTTRSEMFQQLRVYAPENCRLAGVQASVTATSTATGWQRSLAHYPPKPLRTMWLVPAITSQPAVDLLKAQAEAEGAALWIDEDGVLQVWDRSRMIAQPVVDNLTAQRHLLDLSWSLDSQDTRRKVVVKYRRPAVSIARRSTLVAYEGQKEELGAGDDQDLWIEPGADEEWTQVDNTARTLFGDFNASWANGGMGTMVGFTGLNANGDEISIMDGSSQLAQWTIELTKVGTRTWHCVTAVTSLPAGVDRVVTQSRTEDTSSVKKAYRGRGLPLLRCMGKAAWSDQEASPGITGPAWATDLEHDAEWFIQSDDQALALAQQIATDTADPKPLFEQIPVRADPRRQLADKLRLQDDTRTGLALLGTVVGVDQSISIAEHTMTLDLMVTVVQHAYVTLNEFDATHTGKTAAQLDTIWSANTLTALDQAPLSK